MPWYYYLIAVGILVVLHLWKRKWSLGFLVAYMFLVLAYTVLTRTERGFLDYGLNRIVLQSSNIYFTQNWECDESFFVHQIPCHLSLSPILIRIRYLLLSIGTSSHIQSTHLQRLNMGFLIKWHNTLHHFTVDINIEEIAWMNRMSIGSEYLLCTVALRITYICKFFMRTAGRHKHHACNCKHRQYTSNPTLLINNHFLLHLSIAEKSL